MFRAFLSIVLLGSAVASAAPPLTEGPANKRAWMLTSEERIALRSNPELARERRHEHGGVRAAASSSAAPTAGGAAGDEWVGSTHPELFMPHEVFRELINLTLTGPPQQAQFIREALTPEARLHELPPDFWERLRAIAAIHAGDVMAERDLLSSIQQLSGRPRQRAQEALTLKRADVCRSRAEALASARNEFGRERFDRFLYEVVAVNMFYLSDRIDDPGLLRSMERGCR